MRALPGKSRQTGRLGKFAGVAVAALLLVLSVGSYDVGFLKDRVQSAVGSNLPPGTVFSASAMRASLGFGTLQVDIRDLRLAVPEKADIEMANLAVDLGLISLLGGEVHPAAIQAEGLAIRLYGSPSPSALSGDRLARARTGLAAFNRALGSIESAMRTQGLESVTVTSASIDAAAAAGSPFADSLPLAFRSLRWQATSGGSRFDAEASAEDGDWTLVMETADEGSGRTTDIRLAGVPPAALLPRLGDTARRPNFDAPADARLTIASTDSGAFGNAKFSLAFGKGHLSLVPRDRTTVDGAELAVSLPAAGDRLDLTRLALVSGSSELSLAGAFAMGEFGRPVTFDATLDKGVFPGMSENDEPVSLDRGHARVTIDPSAGRIALQEAVVSGPEGRASLRGEFVAAGAEPGLGGILEIGETTPRMIHALWPPMVARQARNWFHDNVQAGLAGPGRLEITLPALYLGPQGKDRRLPSNALVGEIPFRDAQFTPTPQLPAIRSPSGSVEFANATIIARLDEAEVTVPGSGTARIGNSHFRVPDLGQPGAVGYLDLQMTGSANVLAHLSNSGPLSIAADRGLSPTDLSGDGRLELFAEIPLGNPITQKDVRADFALRLTDFGSRAPLPGGRRISHADLDLAGTTESFTISGNAVIDGIPAQLELASSSGAGPQAARLTLDEEARRQLGIDLGPFVSGPVVALLDPAATSLDDIALDLTPTDINLPFVGWHKLPGVAAMLEARVKKGPDGTEISRIRLTGDGFRASGDVEIDAEGRLASMDARDIRLRPDEDFDIAVARVGARLKIDVRGEAVDLRGIVSALQHPEAPAPADPPPIDLRFEIGRLIGHNDTVIENVAGTAALTRGRIDTLSVSVGADDGNGINLAPDTETGERLVTASFNDAGAILRFLNVYRTAYGGSINVKFSGPPDAVDGNGHVGIYGFRVREGDRNILVRRMSIPFSRKGPVIAIGKASMTADGLDATARGSINLDSRYMSVRGTIVPTNGLNRLPASVPVLGDLLGARKRKGLIGVAFTLAGPLSSPELKLNVASAVTPGFVRRIFGNGK